MAEKQENTPATDAKAKMRELLEKKKQGAGAGPHAAATGASKADGAHGKAGGKREFRRKSS